MLMLIIDRHHLMSVTWCMSVFAHAGNSQSALIFPNYPSTFMGLLLLLTVWDLWLIASNFQ